MGVTVGLGCAGRLVQAWGVAQPHRSEQRSKLQCRCAAAASFAAWLMRRYMYPPPDLVVHMWLGRGEGGVAAGALALNVRPRSTADASRVDCPFACCFDAKLSAGGAKTTSQSGHPPVKHHTRAHCSTLHPAECD